MKNVQNFLFIIFTCFILSINNNSFSQLNGTFTIGTGGDYNKIASAIITLHAIGVNGPVVFNILSGVYEERQLILNSFPGSSEINTVTFKSQTGNYNNVTVNNPLDSGYTLLINGADNITFKNIYFQNISSVTLKTAVKFTGECDNIKILNNKFWGSSTDLAIGSENAKMTNLEIGNNLFTIRNAVYLPENLLVSQNTKIYGNTFSNCQFGITASKHYNMTIENNVMSILQGYGIYVGDCNGDLKILKNKITPHVFQYYYTIDGIKVAPFSGTSCLIANNMISVPQGTGMYIANCVNTKIFYNTIRASSVYSGDLALTSNTGVNLKNNIYVQLANSGTSTLTYDVRGSIISSDYNNFYFLSDLIMHYNQFGYINTLQQYQSLSGQDLHSVSKEVNFVSATNLHLDGSSNGDLDLAGIPLTEVTDDIDGNPRNPLYPYMGADEPDIVLPVELVSFTFQIDERNVILKWTTSSEENNSGFEIQRNQNQSEWKVIGFSESNGNSTSPEDYAFTDNNLNSGKYNYRLKQIDFNGSFKYYNLNNEVVINVPEKYSLFQNYPNPFNPKTTINYQIPAAINVTMKVFDISGKEISTLVNEKKEAGFYSVDFDGTDLSSGTYIYTLLAGDFVSTRRMIVIK